MSNLSKSSEGKGYESLLKTVVLQAIKDYYVGTHRGRFAHYRDEVRGWVSRCSGTFDLCADAMNKTSGQFQQLMWDKMKQIDAGEPLFLKEPNE